MCLVIRMIIWTMKYDHISGKNLHFLWRSSLQMTAKMTAGDISKGCKWFVVIKNIFPEVLHTKNDQQLGEIDFIINSSDIMVAIFFWQYGRLHGQQLSTKNTIVCLYLSNVYELHKCSFMSEITIVMGNSNIFF